MNGINTFGGFDGHQERSRRSKERNRQWKREMNVEGIFGIVLDLALKESVVTVAESKEWEKAFKQTDLKA